MMKRVKVLLFISLLLVTTINIMAVSADGEDSPIYIIDNGDFATYATSGNGLVGDPYIISGFFENETGYSAVYISNTDAYCVFDDVSISERNYGFFMKNVSNVNITNSYIGTYEKGILLENCSKIGLVENDFAVSLSFGVRIDSCDRVLVENCTFVDMEDGIQLWDSFQVRIKDNTFIGTGVSFYGTTHVSEGVAVIGNTVNGKPLGYLYNAHDMLINVGAYGQVILVNCVNVTLHSGDIVDTNIAVQFIFCMNSNIALSNITGNINGILFYESSYCRSYANNISGNGHGLLGYFAIGTKIYENNIMNNIGYGIWMWYGCSSSSIYLNNFINNYLSNARDDGGLEDSSLTWVGARFYNSLSRVPLSNVSILVERAGRSYQAYTNEKGIIKLPVPALGTYDLTISNFRYETITTSKTITVPGVHLFNVPMNKADLGPGTGYVLGRFMDGATPVVGAVVNVYSVLDGAYYYHSTHTSAVSPAGWVNITGLYYDDYIFIVDAAGYDRRIINQVIIATGEAEGSPYNNLQLVGQPTDAFIYGNVYDEISLSPLEGVNITIYDAFATKTVFTDSDGFYNVTDILFGNYMGEISLSGYVEETYPFLIDSGGSFHVNPFDVYLVEESAEPETAGDAVVNNYDTGLVGNYWDDYSGSPLVLADEGTYAVPGDNLGNPTDDFPLAEPYVPESEPIPSTTTTSIPTSTSTTIGEEPEDVDYSLFMLVGIGSIVLIIAVVLFLRKGE